MDSDLLSPPPNEVLKAPRQYTYFRASIASELHPDHNEDTAGFNSHENFAMVLDGMGGVAGGQEASLLGAREIKRKINGIPSNSDPEQVRRKLEQALTEASWAVEANPIAGGATATVAKFLDNGVVIGHVGDSRAYVLRRDGKLEQITQDQNGFTEQENHKFDRAVSQGDLTVQEQERFKHRNQITHSLGERDPNVKTYYVPLEDGDKVLITSDGVHDNLAFQDIEYLLLSSPDDPAQALVNSALHISKKGHFRSKPDDISAIVIAIKDESSRVFSNHLEPATEQILAQLRLNSHLRQLSRIGPQELREATWGLVHNRVTDLAQRTELFKVFYNEVLSEEYSFDKFQALVASDRLQQSNWESILAFLQQTPEGKARLAQVYSKYFAQDNPQAWSLIWQYAPNYLLHLQLREFWERASGEERSEINPWAKQTQQDLEGIKLKITSLQEKLGAS